MNEPAPQTAMPWYCRAFQEGYLALYSHRDLAEAARAVALLARELAIEPGDRVLDLCCGPGRHMAFLGRTARQVVGLDLSAVLLARAREHWRDIFESGPPPEVPAQRLGRDALLVRGTMRRLPLADGSFDRVVNLFTSFGYYDDEERNMAVLREVARVLRGDAGGRAGMFALDHINLGSLLKNLEPRTERRFGHGGTVVEERRWDAARRRVTKDVRMLEGGETTKQWHESVRVYEPEELEAMLGAAGLRPLRRLGGYDGGPWDEHAPRLILIAEKTR